MRRTGRKIKQLEGAMALLPLPEIINSLPRWKRLLNYLASLINTNWGFVNTHFVQELRLCEGIAEKNHQKLIPGYSLFGVVFPAQQQGGIIRCRDVRVINEEHPPRITSRILPPWVVTSSVRNYVPPRCETNSETTCIIKVGAWQRGHCLYDMEGLGSCRTKCSYVLPTRMLTNT